MATRRGWGALVIEVPEGLEDEIAGTFGVGSLGVEIRSISAGRCAIRVFVPTLEDARALLETARSGLRTHGLDDPGQAAVEAVDDLRWVERYQEGLRPFPLGDRFVVVPHGRPHAEPGRTSILLVPGRAFGTGEHPTTRLCAAALERWVEPGSLWLDLGCGSAILSVVAARCGAGSVIGRDDDPEAVEVAEEVVRANALAGRIRLEVGSASDLTVAPFDGIVANIATPYFLAHADDCARLLRTGGVLAAAGFLVEDDEPVARALARSGLDAVEDDSALGWGLVVARRAAR